MQPTVESTVAFVQQAHEGQTDKGGKPYWLHPLSVMRRLGDDASDAEKMAALLHDVLEDCDYTRGDLKDIGYPDDVLEAVEMLTRPDGWTYMDWIRSLAASGNRIAIKVKIADNEDNSDPDRIAVLPPEERDIVRRYERSLKILRAA